MQTIYFIIISNSKKKKTITLFALSNTISWK